MSATIAERLADASSGSDAQGAVRQGLSRDHLRPAGWPRSATRASCPLEGKNLAEAAQSYFAQSEQIPSLVRLAADEARRALVRGRPAAPASARRRGGPRAAAYAARPSRLAARRDPWRIGEAGGADRPGASARRSDLAAVPRRGGSADAAGDRAQPRLPLRPRLCAFGDRPFPGRRARGDGRRGRGDPRRLRLLLVELRRSSRDELA